MTRPAPSPVPYPISRPRRLRRSASLRALTRETRLSVEDLIWPVFVHETGADGDGPDQPVPSMPGVARRSIDLGRPRGGRGGVPGHPGDLPVPLHRAVAEDRGLRRRLG